MLDARARAPTEPLPPFADTAGGDYFLSDAHLRTLVPSLCAAFRTRRGIAFLSGYPLPSAELLSRYIEALPDSGFRATPVQCHRGTTFGEIIESCCRRLGLAQGAPDEADDAEWTLLTQFMQEARRGTVRVLVVENAESIANETLDELLRFIRVDEPNLIPVVLLGTAAGLAKLENALSAVPIVARLPIQRLGRDEVAEFIGHQLRDLATSERRTLSPETVAAIAAAAIGDPVLVNRMVRLALWRADPDEARRPAATTSVRSAAPSFAPAAEAAQAPVAVAPGVRERMAATASPAAASTLRPHPVRRPAEATIAPSVGEASGVAPQGSFGPTNTPAEVPPRMRIRSPAQVAATGWGLRQLWRARRVRVLAGALGVGAAVAAAALLMMPLQSGDPPQAALSPPAPEPSAPAPATAIAASRPSSPVPPTPPPAPPSETILTSPSTAPPAPAPRAAVPAVTAAATTVPVVPPAARAKSYRLQLGALRTPEAADHEWVLVKQRHADLLGTLEANIQRVDLGERGLYYRVIAGPIVDATQAERDCAELKRRGQACIIVRP